MQNQDNSGDTQTYHMMTSVSLPVYDKKPRQVSCKIPLPTIQLFIWMTLSFVQLCWQNITENVQVNEAIWITVTREVHDLEEL